MAAALLLLFQAAIVPQPDERLLHPVPPATCHHSATEIVVCGRDSETYRLPKPDPASDMKGPPMAEWGLIGDTKMSMHAEARSGAGGALLPPAAMVTITIPF